MTHSSWQDWTNLVLGVYLALAPKANTAIASYGNARRLVKELGPLPVPLKLRNAPTKLMEGLGYGGGYRYPHNFEGHYVADEYLPDAIRGERIVQLSESGLEKALGERLRALRAVRERARVPGTGGEDAGGS